MSIFVKEFFLDEQCVVVVASFSCAFMLLCFMCIVYNSSLFSLFIVGLWVVELQFGERDGRLNLSILWHLIGS